MTGSAVAPEAATRAAGRPSSSSPETSGSSWLSSPAACGGRLPQPRRRPGRCLAPAHRPPPAQHRAHLGQSLSAPFRLERQAAARRSQRRRRPRRGLPGRSSPRQRRCRHRRQRALAYGPAQEQLRLARPRRSGQVVAGSRRAPHVWGMPSRSLQRLPPRYPLHRRTAAHRSGFDALAGRAGSRHRHPLPDMQDKAEHPAGTRAACQLPETNHDRNPGGSLVLPHHTTPSRGGPGHCPAPGHPDSCRICPHPPQTL